MILLDTFSLIALTSQQENLSIDARKILATNSGKIFTSAATAYELGIEHNKKLIELPTNPQSWYSKALALHGLTELPITGKIALLATQLPQLHDDLVDRLLIATTKIENLTILTPNKQIHLYPEINWIW
ncbi:MAG: type II toxin-antitoxin system VapC family toxin [Gammaproteobacteria bacterium]|nr:type II toxin-antitoxin system VapC family toxin [Gammaproteobacteria bacterium]